MRYIALLRGINVGGKNKVVMKDLTVLFESLDCFNVSTYINSGNVIFESKDGQDTIIKKVKAGFKQEYDFEIPFLVKTENEMKKIAGAIPKEWQNDSTHKTDVAYLFPEIDSKEILDELPVKKEFIDVRYVPGALFWNIDRNNYNKSNLNKIISHRVYQFMTVRNVNTARYLAEHK